jgi:hypothetical protein
VDITGVSNQNGRKSASARPTSIAVETEKRSCPLDQQVNAVADRVPHRCHDRQGAPKLVPVDEPVGVAERVELGGGVAHRGDLACPLGEERRLARPLVPAVGVGPDAGPGLAAEQPPDRRVQAPAEDVPAGHVDPGHGGILVEVEPLVHGVPDGPDVQRVQAQHERLQLVDGGLDRPGPQPLGRLADTNQPFVGEHLHEDPVLPGIADHRRPQVHDLHDAILSAPH